MNAGKLEEHIRALAALPETEAPIISCYAEIAGGRVKDPKMCDGQMNALKMGRTCVEGRLIDDALSPVRLLLSGNLEADSKGLAVFSRAGQEPYLLFLQFRVPLPTWITAGKFPSIFHLVEMKDTYERYVVMLGTRERVRIFEINLGELTEHARMEAAGLGRGQGEKWSKEHYQRRTRENQRRFVKEQIKVLARLFEAGNHRHLILAGHPAVTAGIREELPPELAEKLEDVVRVSEKGHCSGIVEATIKAFVEAEERASQEVAESLARQVHTGGLAVVGGTASLEALRRNQVDTLVLLNDYNPGSVWFCRTCNSVDAGHQPQAPSTCTCCGAEGAEYLDLKEELVRIAEKHHCAVEVVNKSNFLAEAGGVGCLLRYRNP